MQAGVASIFFFFATVTPPLAKQRTGVQRSSIVERVNVQSCQTRMLTTWSPHILHAKLDNLLSLLSFMLVIDTTEADSGGGVPRYKGRACSLVRSGETGVHSGLETAHRGPMLSRNPLQTAA